MLHKLLASKKTSADMRQKKYCGCLVHLHSNNKGGCRFMLTIQSVRWSCFSDPNAGISDQSSTIAILPRIQALLENTARSEAWVHLLSISERRRGFMPWPLS